MKIETVCVRLASPLPFPLSCITLPFISRRKLPVLLSPLHYLLFVVVKYVKEFQCLQPWTVKALVSAQVNRPAKVALINIALNWWGMNVFVKLNCFFILIPWNIISVTKSFLQVATSKKHSMDRYNLLSIAIADMSQTELGAFRQTMKTVCLFSNLLYFASSKHH